MTKRESDDVTVTRSAVVAIVGCGDGWRALLDDDLEIVELSIAAWALDESGTFEPLFALAPGRLERATLPILHVLRPNEDRPASVVCVGHRKELANS